VPWFPSLEMAIEAVRPHAAVIATPNNTHHDLALLAIERGVGLLVEKPLANTLAAARAIADAVDATGVAASCGYVLAYLPAYERAKEILDAGALGTITSFESSMFLSQVFGPKQGWLYDPEKAGGGVLPNVTSHLLFLLRWYFGEVVQVSATSRRLHTAVEDEASLRLAFPEGVEGTVDTSWSVQGYPQSVTAIRIRGENGTMEADNQGLVLTLDEPAGELPSGMTRIHPADLQQAERYHLVREGYSREGEDFLRAVRSGGPVRTSIRLALGVQAIMDAAYRSSEQGGAAVTIAAPNEARAPS
jgi:predicted dehydrogenase